MGELETSADRSTAWTRADTVALLVLIGGALATLPWLVHPWFDARNDASMYVLTARALLSGEGYTLLGEPFVMRPPGFPVLLTAVLGPFGLDFPKLNAFVSLFGVAAVALLYVLQRPRIGTLPALAVAGAIWLNPGFQRLCTQVMSDVPGLALILLALVIERRTRDSRSPRGVLGLAVLIGVSAYVRSIALLLVPAVIVSRLVSAALDRGGIPPLRDAVYRHCLLLALVPLAVQAPWKIRNAVVDVPPIAEQTFLHSYGVTMWHTDPGDASSPRVGLRELLERVPEQAEIILPAIGSRLLHSRPEPLETVLGGLALAACLLSFLRRREAPELFVLGGVTLFLVYFTFPLRLALPAVVIALPAVADAVSWVTGRLLPPAAARLLVAVAVMGLAIHDFAPRRGWTLISTGHEMHAGIARRITEEIPADTVLAAPVGWDLAVHSGRPVYSLEMTWWREGQPGSNRILDAHGIRCFVFNRKAAVHRDIWSAIQHRCSRRFRWEGWVVADVEPEGPR